MQALKNINQELSKETQKQQLIDYLICCFDMSEESARAYVEKSFSDLKGVNDKQNTFDWSDV